MNDEIEISSPDIEDLETYDPPDGSSWEIPLEVCRDGDSFQLTACSLQWIEEQVTANPAFFTGRLVVMKRFSYDLLLEATQRVYAECDSGDDVQQTYVKLNWFMQSEHEYVGPEHRPTL